MRLWKPIILLLLLGACAAPGGLSGGLTAGQSMGFTAVVTPILVWALPK